MNTAKARPHTPTRKTTPDPFVVNAEGAAAEPLSAQAALMLPAQVLHPGEVVVLLLRPSPLYILLAPLRTLIVILLGVLLVALVQRRGVDLGLSTADLVLAGAGLVGARLFWQVLEWLNRIYILTDRRVIRVRGVINVHVFERPLAEVRRVDLLRPAILRVFGLGTLGYITNGDNTYEAYWHMLAKPQEVHDTVNQTLKRYRR